jgi:hypothetical protein
VERQSALGLESREDVKIGNLLVTAKNLENRTPSLTGLVAVLEILQCAAERVSSISPTKKQIVHDGRFL